MSSYWDAVGRDVHEARSMNLADESFRTVVANIELAVIQTVSLAVGDREFPNDMRERILGSIAVNCLDHNWTSAKLPPHEPDWNKDAVEWLQLVGYSRLLEDLHGHFHEVASLRVMTRFGVEFTDDPSTFLKARDEALNDHDGSGRR